MRLATIAGAPPSCARRGTSAAARNGNATRPSGRRTDMPGSLREPAAPGERDTMRDTMMVEESLLRVLAGIYVLVGLRMAIWASQLYRPGVLKRDLPRYAYQRQRWARAGFRSERFSVQYEILVQAMANTSFLAVPAYLVATDASRAFGAWAGACIALWLAAYAFESVADLQKRRFARSEAARRDAVCDVGLWRYSRHPNYFGQWLQWIALVAFAAPSLLATRCPSFSTGGRDRATASCAPMRIASTISPACSRPPPIRTRRSCTAIWRCSIRFLSSCSIFASARHSMVGCADGSPMPTERWAHWPI